MAKQKPGRKPSPEDVKAGRTSRAELAAAEAAERDAPAEEAREIQFQARRDEEAERAEAAIKEAQAKAEAAAEEDHPEPTLHDGKVGSGAGLKPGDWHAPASNPGAAAQVPSAPLQPESMQSHGQGILYDKDLCNPPYDLGDPLEVDAPPTGSGAVGNTGGTRYPAGSKPPNGSPDTDDEDEDSGRGRRRPTPLPADGD